MSAIYFHSVACSFTKRFTSYVGQLWKYNISYDEEEVDGIMTSVIRSFTASFLLLILCEYSLYIKQRKSDNNYQSTQYFNSIDLLTAKHVSHSHF